MKEGDCIVAFSVSDIFEIQREIETTTSHKCCLVYGSLPPIVRSQVKMKMDEMDEMDEMGMR